MANNKGSFKVNASLVVASWDRWLEVLTGISPEQALGRSLDDLIPDVEARGWLRILTQLLLTPAAVSCSVERQLFPGTPDGLVSRLQVGAREFEHLFAQLPLGELGPGLILCPSLLGGGKLTQMQQRVTITTVALDGSVGLLLTIEDITAQLEAAPDMSGISEGELAVWLTSDSEVVRLRGVQTLVQGWGAAQEAGVDGVSIEIDVLSSLLVSALGDESWRVRQAAVDGLAKHSSESIVPTLVRLIREQHEDLSVLNSTLSVLALSNLDTIAPLSRLLREEADPNLRIYVAQVLGELHNPQAIPVLMAVLDDPDMNLRYHAIEALGNLRATEAVEILAEIAESRDFFLAFPALAALMRIGEPAVAPRLVPLMQDELLCEPAAGALGLLGDKDVVKPLAQLLNLPDVPVAGIARALAALYHRYEEVYGEGVQIALETSAAVERSAYNHLVAALPVADAAELEALVLVLSWLEGEAIERALVGLLGSSTVGDMAAAALVRYGARATSLLVGQLSSEQPEACRRAVMALGRIGDSRAVAPLTEMLRRVSGLPPVGEEVRTRTQWGGLAPELAISCADALAKIGMRDVDLVQSRQAMEALIELLGNEDAGCRQAAIAALDSLGHPEMPSYLIGGVVSATGEVRPSLLQHPHAYVRESAVKIAGYFGFPECISYLLAACADPEERVRRAAIEILPYLEMDEQVLPLLAAALVGDVPTVRAAAARSLEMLEVEGAYRALLKALQDEDVWVRYYAVRSLGRMGRPGALPYLGQLVQESGEAPQVRVAAVKALGSIGGAGAVEALEALLFSAYPASPGGDDVGVLEPDLVLAAIAALGQIQSPEALLPLLRLLQSPERERRVDALRALGETGSQGVAEAIYAVALADGDALVRRSAVDALAGLAAGAQSGDDWAAGAEAMLALIELMGDPGLGEACVAALTSADVVGRIATEERIKWLATGLGHELPVVRRLVVEVLTRLKKPAASQKLIMALGDGDAGVRLASIRSLGHLGNRDCLGIVADLARSDPDPGVRRGAQKMLQM